ncbi:MAG: 4-hydroxy-3-methylbut-2-enyl diphosphate reductase [Nitrosomonadales bacterium]
MIEIKLQLANPRGFCAGVERAIEIVEAALEKYGAPIYVKHEVVHNKFVIDDLKKRGVHFIEDLSTVPQGSHIIFSAHGVSKNITADANKFNLIPIDATCPLVTKVHTQVNTYLKNKYFIIMIGHRNHPEVEGTLGQASSDEEKQKMYLVESAQDVSNLNINPNENIAYVTQTTLSMNETKEIINALTTKYPNIKGPDLKDICYATQNRQDAIIDIIKKHDLLIVVGSENSSNSNRLFEIGIKNNVSSYLIDNPDLIQNNWFIDKKNILLTSGASAPEELTQRILNKIKKLTSAIVSELPAEKENVFFKLPLI